MVKTELLIQIDGEPVPKGRPRVTKGGTFTPQRSVEYEARVRMLALQARQRWSTSTQNTGPWPMAARYAVSVSYYPGDAVRRDGDNILKALLDGCIGVLYDDDNQIDVMRLERRWPVSDHPRVVVMVTAYGDPLAPPPPKPKRPSARAPVLRAKQVPAKDHRWRRNLAVAPKRPKGPQ